MLIQKSFGAFDRGNNSAAYDGFKQILSTRETQVKRARAHACPGGNVLQPCRGKPAFDR